MIIDGKENSVKIIKTTKAKPENINIVNAVAVFTYGMIESAISMEISGS